MDTTPYFPGCTLSTTARSLDLSGRAVAEAIGLPLEELPEWQCCGVTFPLAIDNSLALIAATRTLVQAEQQGDRVATLCAMCYNVLKRTDAQLRRTPEQLERINHFLSTDATSGGRTYHGGVRVVHFIEMLRDDLGWDRLAQQVAKVRSGHVSGLKIAPYYGCLLLRPPSEMCLDDPESPTILSDFLRSLGAEPVEFPFQNECCGSYLAVSRPNVPSELGRRILEQAAQAGAQAIVTACPLCQHNLQKAAAGAQAGARLPILYFTQLLAAALDLPQEAWSEKDDRAAEFARSLFAGLSQPQEERA